MSEESFEQLLNEEGSLNQIRTGAVVKGTVIGVKENEISLNINYKADGIVTKSEYTNDPAVVLADEVKVGDEMEVKVLKVNDGEGQVALSYKRLAQDRVNKALEEAYENRTVLTGTVKEVNKGGLSVVVGDAQVFMPASLVNDNYEKDLSKYLGQDIEFYISEFKPKQRRIVGDRRTLVAERKEAAKKALFDELAVGEVRTGKVKNIREFGAFIDLGGADGLLHISEMTWGRIDNPHRIYKVGDEVEAYVKEINENKIGLSVKFPEDNPWVADSRYAIGSVVTGKVARMTDFGAFVELEPGIDALLHVSQIAKERVEKPSDVLTQGQEITAKVVDFIPEEHKISLSIKELEMDTPSEETAEPAEE